MFLIYEQCAQIIVINEKIIYRYIMSSKGDIYTLKYLVLNKYIVEVFSEDNGIVNQNNLYQKMTQPHFGL